VTLSYGFAIFQVFDDVSAIVLIGITMSEAKNIQLGYRMQTLIEQVTSDITAI
jgi:hypothetical protein